MVHVVHSHYSGTSCLCECHFSATADCDIRECAKTARTDAARSFVAPTIAYDGRADAGTYCQLVSPMRGDLNVQPVMAQAAEPMQGFVTPFGVTTRVGR